MASHSSTTLIKTPIPALAILLVFCLVSTAANAVDTIGNTIVSLTKAEKQQQKQLEKLQRKLSKQLAKQQRICKRLSRLELEHLPAYCDAPTELLSETLYAANTDIRQNTDTSEADVTNSPARTVATDTSLSDSTTPFSTLNTFSVQSSQSVYVPQLLTALQSGPISDPTTFGVLPQNGDRLDAGNYTITIDQSFTAGQITDVQGSVALTGEFIVNAGTNLIVNGDWDASQPNTQNILKTGASIEFDGNSGVTRTYKAASQYYGYPSLRIEATPDNKAFFGLKPGSAATFKYDKHVYLGSNISGGNVHLNGFSTGYIHDGYDRVATRDCDMPNTLLTNSGQFELRYYAGDNGSCDLSNLTILSSTHNTALFTIGSSGSSTQGSSFNLNGLSVDGGVGYYTRPEFMMNDWVIKELSMTLPQNAYQNISNWLLYNVSTLPVGAANMSSIYYRNERSNPHGFSLAGGSLSSRTLDSVIFDFLNLDATESGDNYLFDGAGTANETVNIQNNISLKNINGNQSSTFVTFNSSNQNGRQVNINNNVVFVPWINRAISLNEAGETPSNILNSVSNNIFWGDTGKEGYVAQTLTTSSATDILASGAYSNNAVYQTRSDGQFDELDLPLSYIPNSPATTNAPRFHDNQRRLATYGSAVLGLDGTDETAYYAFITRHLSANDITRLSQLAGHSHYTNNYQGSLQISDLIS